MNNKIFLTIICLLAIIFGIQIFSKKETKQKTTLVPAVENIKENKTFELKNLEGIDYSIKDLPENTITYLKTKSEFKDLYKDKKFVIYYIGADCPYAQTFINTIEPLTKDSAITEKYNFYPQEAAGMTTFSSMEEAQASLDFSHTCQEFCIVNPARNQVFAIDGIGEQEAGQINNILEQLKEW